MADLPAVPRRLWGEFAAVFAAVFGALTAYLQFTHDKLGPYEFLGGAFDGRTAYLIVAGIASVIALNWVVIRSGWLALVTGRVTLIASADELQRELTKVVKSSRRFLVCTGSRTRSSEYLSGIINHLRDNSRLVHYRILYGPPQHPELVNHLKALIKLRDPADHSLGYQTLHIGVMPPASLELSLCASEKRAVVVLPSLNSAGNFDSGIVVSRPRQAERLVNHVKELYPSAAKCETEHAIDSLTTQNG